MLVMAGLVPAIHDFHLAVNVDARHQARRDDGGGTNGKRFLLIVGGGLAAYKSLELVRRLKERGASSRAILTKGGAEFVTPLSLSVLTEEKAFTALFDLKDEAEIGRIRLSR